MVRYILQQIKITSSRAFGKWFAKNVVEETIDLDALAEHMSNHNSPYSKVQCIKELLLEGKNVKIDDLAIFSLGIKNKLMADWAAGFRDVSDGTTENRPKKQLLCILTPATSMYAV